MRAGYSLIEATLTLTILSLLTGLAAPGTVRMLDRTRTAAALNQFTADFHLARVKAVRDSRRTELVLVNTGGCKAPPQMTVADSWLILTAGGMDTLRTMPAGSLGRGVCLETKGDARLVINTRGLLAPFENRTVWVRKGAVADTLTINVTCHPRFGPVRMGVHTSPGEPGARKDS